MTPYAFAKKLTWSMKEEYSCFVYSEYNASQEMENEFQRLRETEEIEIIWRDFRDSHDCYVDYYFKFIQDGLTESYKTMIDL